MGIWIKRILLTLLVLLVLLVVAAIAIPYLYRDKIEAAVKHDVNENINATVEWGDWDLSIIRSFPNVNVAVENVRICNKAPFEGICLADIGELRATIGLFSLFESKTQILNITLVHPTIHIKVLKDGRGNWDIAKADSTNAELATDTTATRFDIALKKYSITKGRIIYDDESLPMLMDLAGLEHEGSGDFTQDDFTLKTKTTADTVNVVYGGVKYLRSAKVDITADIGMNLPGMKFTFQENDIKVNQLELGMDGWLAMPAKDIDMDLKWDMKKNDIAALLSLVPAEFATNLKGVDMSGKATFNGYVKGTYNEKNMPGFGVNINVDKGRFKYPDLPASVEDIYLDCNIQSPQGHDMDGMVVDLKRFAMNMAGNPVEARMHLTTPISDPNVDASLKADLDLASVKKVVPLPKGDELSGKIKADVKMVGRMSDVEAQRYDKFIAEGQMALSGMQYKSDSLPYVVGINSLVLDFSPKFLAVPTFVGNLGKSDINANGRVDNYLQWWLKDSTLTGTFNVQSKVFDLNELMGSSSTSAPASGTPAADSSAMQLIEVPKNLDLTLNAAVGQVLYDKMVLADAKGALRVHDERVDLRGLTFGLFEGLVKMDGTYNTADKVHPKFDLTYDVKGLDIKQVVDNVETVAKMAPIAKNCRGRFSTAMSLSGELDQAMSPLMNTLAGQGTLKTTNVTIEGFKPLIEISNVLKMPRLATVDVQNIDFSYEFKDGRMVTKPFDVKIDRLTANVSGSTAFADQAIDYTMKAKVPTDMFGADAGQLVSGLLGQLNKSLGTEAKLPSELELTAKITGTIEKPVVKPVFGGGANVKETITEEIKQGLNDQIDKVKTDAIAQARAEAARLVAEAQKQADDIKAKARSEAANVKSQAYAEADKLVSQAKDPFSKAAAKLGADKAKKLADEKEQQFVGEADKRANGLVDAASKQGDALIQKAESTDTKLK
ncbi:MAG: AsmA family protein [Flavobacteriales bacterium]|nr:AsmA family protein [Flavobacteriales bacterium]